MLFEFTEAEAKSLGLLVCESCGHPENNHFDFRSLDGERDKPCAHCSKERCAGYKAVASVGSIVDVVNLKVGTKIRIYGEVFQVCRWQAKGADEQIAIDVKKVKG